MDFEEYETPHVTFRVEEFPNDCIERLPTPYASVLIVMYSQVN